MKCTLHWCIIAFWSQLVNFLFLAESNNACSAFHHWAQKLQSTSVISSELETSLLFVMKSWRVEVCGSGLRRWGKFMWCDCCCVWGFYLWLSFYKQNVSTRCQIWVKNSTLVWRHWLLFCFFLLSEQNQWSVKLLTLKSYTSLIWYFETAVAVPGFCMNTNNQISEDCCSRLIPWLVLCKSI